MLSSARLPSQEAVANESVGAPMTWVKLSDDALDDPRLLAVPRGAILLHLEALAFSNRHGLGGAIPRVALRKVTTEEDPDVAAAALVDAGLWTATDDGWQLVWLLEDQPSAEEVETTRKRWRDAQATTRKRRELHLAGDHSTCDPRRCRVLLKGGVNVDSSADSSADSTPPPTPTRLRPDPEERGRGGGGAAGARSGSGGPRAPRRTKGTNGVQPSRELCFFCAQPAPPGLALMDNGDGKLVHPSEDVPDEWRPYITDEWGSTCPPDLPEYDMCGWCIGGFPIDEMTEISQDDQGRSTYACSTCEQTRVWASR